MTDSCPHTFTQKDFIGRIGFAPSRVAVALAVPGGEPHRCIYVCRCADDPGQAVGGCRRRTHFVYSSALLRRGSAMPPRHRTRAHANQWPELSCQRKSGVARCESTAPIASFSFFDGVASTTQRRSASCVAARGNAINNFGLSMSNPMRSKIFVQIDGRFRSNELL